MTNLLYVKSKRAKDELEEAYRSVIESGEGEELDVKVNQHFFDNTGFEDKAGRLDNHKIHRNEQNLRTFRTFMKNDQDRALKAVLDVYNPKGQMHMRTQDLAGIISAFRQPRNWYEERDDLDMQPRPIRQKKSFS